jgi:amidase
VPADGQRPAPPSGTPRAQFSLVGPLARTAGDVALALSVLASSPELDSATERDRTLRCTWATGEGTVVVRADVVAVLEHAARALAETGHVVAEGLPPGFERAQPLFGELRVTDDYADLAELVQGREADLTPRIRGLLDDAPPAPDPATRDALLAELRDLRARVDALLEETPVLLLPVAVVPAFPTGSTTLDVDGRIHVVDAMTILAPCRAVSVLGLPAASVPAGVSRDGTPVGVQVVGRAGREDDVLAVAAELEAALGGWQPPPVPPHAHSDSRTVQGPAPGSSIR